MPHILMFRTAAHYKLRILSVKFYTQASLWHLRASRFNARFHALLHNLAVVVIVVHIYFSQRIEAQQTRNGYLEDQIGLLDKKIEEIKQLENEKAKLLARMRAIEQLQGNRPLIVRFFDEPQYLRRYGGV